ncbi:AI-2E family transporter [Sellimonas caecigallum]|uniref:AI-2E family transporter n=1 Tax=Sellimonas caecigallum TaxID=2592333 RepID=A0ABS7L8L5_9FIRM|nr:AI-2E family transporter [Sellimonas caecigallum]
MSQETNLIFLYVQAERKKHIPHFSSVSRPVSSDCLPLISAHKFHAPVKSLLQTIIQVFEDYIAGQCKEAFILGVLCFCGMTVLNLDYAGLISVVITFTALVLILGAYIGGAIGVLLLLFISPGKALLFLVFLIVLQQFEGNVIYLRVVGRKIGLPGIWVLVAISVGSGIMGIWGMLIGVPLTTILYQLIQKNVRKQELRISNSENTKG